MYIFVVLVCSSFILYAFLHPNVNVYEILTFEKIFQHFRNIMAFIIHKYA